MNRTVRRAKFRKSDPLRLRFVNVRLHNSKIDLKIFSLFNRKNDQNPSVLVPFRKVSARFGVLSRVFKPKPFPRSVCYSIILYLPRVRQGDQNGNFSAKNIRTSGLVPRFERFCLDPSTPAHTYANRARKQLASGVNN